MSKEFLSRLKEEAQSRPPPRIKVDGLKKWIQENYAVKRINIFVYLLFIF